MACTVSVTANSAVIESLSDPVTIAAERNQVNVTTHSLLLADLLNSVDVSRVVLTCPAKEATILNVRDLSLARTTVPVHRDMVPPCESPGGHPSARNSANVGQLYQAFRDPRSGLR